MPARGAARLGVCRMLMGRLGDLGLVEVMQLISLARKSGKLVVKEAEQEGVVVFKDGRIVFAASGALHVAVSSGLGEHRPAAPPSGADIEAVIREQIETVVRELISWPAGRFVFETAAVPEVDGIALDAGGFVLETGLNPDEVLLKTLTKLDERSRRGWVRDLRLAATEEEKEPEPPRSEISGIFRAIVRTDDDSGSWVAPRRGRDLADLRSLSDEVSALSVPSALTTDVVLLLLRYAAQVVNRGVLFELGEDGFRGVGQFGLPPGRPAPSERVRAIRVPRGESSMLAEAASTGRPFRGPLPRSRWNDYLLEQLGGGAPLDVIVMPLVIDGETVAILYGDNLPRATRIGAVDGLEILLREVALAVSKTRLERRLQVLEGRERKKR